MTSMAFIMGVIPLVVSTGAGAEMRSAMGVAVFSGMIGVTLFGIFMTPVFYCSLACLPATGRCVSTWLKTCMRSVFRHRTEPHECSSGHLLMGCGGRTCF